MISYSSARQMIVEQIGKSIAKLGVENVALMEASARVLAADILADRDYPPFDRSTRDGYAVRAGEVFDGAVLRCVGEIKAGDVPPSAVVDGQCWQIMTGAGLPAGLDAVVMLEQVSREGDAVRFSRNAVARQSVVRRGSEVQAGQVVLGVGTRMGYAELALAAQVRAAGGVPVVLESAGDAAEDLRARISEGLREDVLILSGGVSAGKYDLVEKMLGELGAEIVFDAVAIRPGKPAVFAMCQGKPVFGLPGNPVSTMVTFELLVTAAIDILSGAKARALAFVEAELAEELHEKPGITHFLPAKLEWAENATHDGGGDARLTDDSAARTLTGKVYPLRWQGSGDIAAMVKANCFLVVDAEVSHVATGTRMPVLLRKDVV